MAGLWGPEAGYALVRGDLVGVALTLRATVGMTAVQSTGGLRLVAGLAGVINMQSSAKLQIAGWWSTTPNTMNLHTISVTIRTRWLRTLTAHNGLSMVVPTPALATLKVVPYAPTKHAACQRCTQACRRQHLQGRWRRPAARPPARAKATAGALSVHCGAGSAAPGAPVAAEASGRCPCTRISTAVSNATHEGPVWDAAVCGAQSLLSNIGDMWQTKPG
jgi:hypothetical protein